MTTITFTFNETQFSDLYKDVNGFRPRGHEFYSASDERKQEIWESLIDECDQAMKAERFREAAAILELQSRIHEARALGAETDAQALRWIMDAEGIEEDDLSDGGFEWRLGLPFDHPFTELMHESA